MVLRCLCTCNTYVYILPTWLEYDLLKRVYCFAFWSMLMCDYLPTLSDRPVNKKIRCSYNCLIVTVSKQTEIKHTIGAVFDSLNKNELSRYIGRYLNSAVCQGSFLRPCWCLVCFWHKTGLTTGEDTPWWPFSHLPHLADEKVGRRCLSELTLSSLFESCLSWYSWSCLENIFFWSYCFP